MSLIKENKNKQIIITLLSNGSYNLYPNNSLSLFTNKLHKPINLDSSLYHYVALQEIGVSLNTENIPVPTNKPSIFLLNGILIFILQITILFLLPTKYQLCRRIYIII